MSQPSRQVPTSRPDTASTQRTVAAHAEPASPRNISDADPASKPPRPPSGKPSAAAAAATRRQTPDGDDHTACSPQPPPPQSPRRAMDLQVAVHRAAWPKDISSIVSVGDRALVRYSRSQHTLELVTAAGDCPSPRRRRDDTESQHSQLPFEFTTIGTRRVADSVPADTPFAAPFSSLHVVEGPPSRRAADDPPTSTNTTIPDAASDEDADVKKPVPAMLLLCISADRVHFVVFDVYPPAPSPSAGEGNGAGRYFGVRALGTFPDAVTHFVPFMYRAQRYALGYDADTGAYWVLTLAPLIAARPISGGCGSGPRQPGPVVARGKFRPGWTTVVWKGTHHVRCTRQRFFCYSAATGESLFECVWVRHSSLTSSLCSREHVQISATAGGGGEKVSPATDSGAGETANDEDPEKAEAAEAVQAALHGKGCTVAALTLRGRTACLLYKHKTAGAQESGESTPPEAAMSTSTGRMAAPGGDANSSSHTLAAASASVATNAVLLLQKRVFAHAAPWTHFCTLRDSAVDGAGDDLLFCYAASTGAAWVNRVVAVGGDQPAPAPEVTLYRRRADTDDAIQLTTEALRNMPASGVNVAEFAEMQQALREEEQHEAAAAEEERRRQEQQRNMDGGGSSLSGSVTSSRLRRQQHDRHQCRRPASAGMRVFHRIEALEKATAGCTTYGQSVAVILAELKKDECPPEPAKQQQQQQQNGNGNSSETDAVGEGSTKVRPSAHSSEQAIYAAAERRDAFDAAIAAASKPSFDEATVRKLTARFQKAGVFTARSRPYSAAVDGHDGRLSPSRSLSPSQLPDGATEGSPPRTSTRYRPEWQSAAGHKHALPPPRSSAQYKFEKQRAKHRDEDIPKLHLTAKRLGRLSSQFVTRDDYQKREIERGEKLRQEALTRTRKQRIAERTHVAAADVPDQPTPQEVAATIKKLAVTDVTVRARKQEQAAKKQSDEAAAQGATKDETGAPVTLDDDRLRDQIIRLSDNAANRRKTAVDKAQKRWMSAYGVMASPAIIHDAGSPRKGRVPPSPESRMAASPPAPIGKAAQQALAKRLASDFEARCASHREQTLRSMDEGKRAPDVKLAPDQIDAANERLAVVPQRWPVPPAQTRGAGRPATAHR